MKMLDYNSILKTASSMLHSGLNSCKMPSEEHEIYYNVYNLINDFVEEFNSSPLTLGQRIETLYIIINYKVVQETIAYIFKHKHAALFKGLNANNLYLSVFSKMLDAYNICERDCDSQAKLFNVMHHNIYLYDLNSPTFLLEYPEILKEIYKNDLETALKSICSVLGNNSAPSVELNCELVKLLTYLSAALELPDVYVYSKKLNLDLSIIKKDYFVASGLIKDLEYMQYKSPDIKYYKALIKQRSCENLRYGFH